VVQVVNVAGRDEREAGLLGELRELWVDPRLLLESGVLDLDVDVVTAEDLRQTVEVRRGVLRPPLLERAGDPAREAAREGDEPRGVPLQVPPVDAGLVVVALEIAGRS